MRRIMGTVVDVAMMTMVMVMMALIVNVMMTMVMMMLVIKFVRNRCQTSCQLEPEAALTAGLYSQLELLKSGTLIF